MSGNNKRLPADLTVCCYELHCENHNGYCQNMNVTWVISGITKAVFQLLTVKYDIEASGEFRFFWAERSLAAVEEKCLHYSIKF